jgi:hypothetical protein
MITTPSPFGDLIHQLGSRLRLFYSEAHIRHVKIYDPAGLRDLATECGYRVQHSGTFLLKMNQLLVCRSANHAQSSGQE